MLYITCMKYYVKRPFKSVHQISEAYFRLLKKRYSPVSVISDGTLDTGEKYKILTICNG